MTHHRDLPDAVDQLLPPSAPLAMPQQDFSKAFDGKVHPCAPLDDAVYWTRWGSFLASAVLALAVTGLHVVWLGHDDLSPAEIVLVGLVGATVFWTALTLVTAILGLARDAGQPVASAPRERQSVALLMTLHEEGLQRVETNLRAMMADLAARKTVDRYDIFVLSDTQTLALSVDEIAMIARLRARVQGGSIRLFYRRRAAKSDRKAGNISQWVRNWGGAYDIMVPLDADSFMSAAAISRLVEVLASDARLGLVQSWPQIIAARTLFARMQGFGTALYGQLLARGYARWAGATANYWGHNAAIRVDAFAAHCGLPPGYLSHDSVEAMALRRAGYGVRFLPEPMDSYEEAPPDLVSFVVRDRRWCAGNLQHVPLVFAPGLPLLVRFNLIYGVAGYLCAPLWLAMILVWTFFGASQFRQDLLAPFVLAAVYGALLAPKVMALWAALGDGKARLRHGGAGALIAGTLGETLGSTIYAPIMMLQRSLAVVCALLGRRPSWGPQRRDGEPLSWATLCRFHSMETVLGLMALVAVALGMASFWLLPVGLSLACAVPLSRLSAVEQVFGLLGSKAAFSGDRIWGA